QPRVRSIATQLLVPADQVRLYCHSTMERISRPAGCRIELLAATAPDAAWLAWTSIILGIDLDPERETVIEHPRCDPVVDLPNVDIRRDHCRHLLRSEEHTSELQSRENLV